MLRLLPFAALCLLLAGCARRAPQPAGRPSPTQPAALTEPQKIESLIAGVAGLKDATFIRNGTEYDCQAAADHMRTKWNWKTGEIKTAGDFIRIAGSVSSESGKPYRIRFKDGREMNSGDYLTGELAKIGGR